MAESLWKEGGWWVRHVSGIAPTMSARASTDNQLIEQAKGMSLEKVYTLHVRTTNQCSPLNSPLAWDVAGHGESAKRLALQRCGSGGIRDFEAALSVIGAYNFR